MPARYARGEYPMEFANPNISNMQAILAQAGLDKRTTNLQRAQKARDELVASGQLFTLERPLWGGNSAAYRCYHPEYTRAVLHGAPNLKDYSQTCIWLREIQPHLQAFAATSQARKIIRNGLVTFFTRIADFTVELPAEGGPWFPMYAQDRSNLLSFMGVNRRTLAQGTREYHDKSDNGKAYASIRPLAQHTAWTIPGLENQATSNEIIEGLAAAPTSGVITPLALFMAGSVILPKAGKIPLQKLFPNQPIA